MRHKILQLDVPTKRGNIYPQEVVLAAIRQLSRPLIGQLGASPDGRLDLSKASHIAKNFRIEDGYLTAEIQVLDTPEGKRLQQALEKIEFRASGEGNVHSNPDGTSMVLQYDLTAVNANLTDEAKNELKPELKPPEEKK